MQAPGGPTAGNHAAAVTVLEGTAKPAADSTGGAGGADDLAVALEPHLKGGITQQISAFVLRQQRAQVQCCGVLLNIEVRHHGGVLPVGPAGGLGVPSGFDQAQERIRGGRQGRCLICCAAIVVVVFPLHHQGVKMRLQCRVELRCLQVAEFDPPAASLLVGGLGDRARRFWLVVGFGAGFELDRGAQLVDRGNGGQLGIVRIGSVGRVLGDDADLIQGKLALPHAGSAAGEFVESVGDGGDRLGVCG